MDLTTPESWSGPFHLRGSGLVDILLHLPSRQGSLFKPNRQSFITIASVFPLQLALDIIRNFGNSPSR